jgi:hypothetical protein
VLAAKWALDLPAIHGGHEAWRYTLISGVIPALPLILIRPFLPESPEWARKKSEGTLRRPSIRELFAPELIKTTVLTTLLFAGSYGLAFGAIQQLPQILGAQALNTPNQAGHAAMIDTAKKAVGNCGARSSQGGGQAGNPDGKKRQIGGNASDEAVAKITFWQEIGGMMGRLALAMLAVAIVSRRKLFRVFQLPSLIFVPLLFWWIPGSLGNPDSLGLIKIGIFIAGFLVVAQFSFWGNYIPLVFPMHLRGTGESFAANIGGRILGTAAAWITLTLAASDKPDPARIAIVGACVAGAYA